MRREGSVELVLAHLMYLHNKSFPLLEPVILHPRIIWCLDHRVPWKVCGFFLFARYFPPSCPHPPPFSVVYLLGQSTEFYCSSKNFRQAIARVLPRVQLSSTGGGSVVVVFSFISAAEVKEKLCFFLLPYTQHEMPLSCDVFFLLSVAFVGWRKVSSKPQSLGGGEIGPHAQ